jgi:hypothetical protein
MRTPGKEVEIYGRERYVSTWPAKESGGSGGQHSQNDADGGPIYAAAVGLYNVLFSPHLFFYFVFLPLYIYIS